MRCGVRQGDPLSPLIFVLVAKLLQAAINDAMRKHLLHHPFKDDHDTDFLVIQYADDMLIIMQACTTQASLMRGSSQIMLNLLGYASTFRNPQSCQSTLPWNSVKISQLSLAAPQAPCRSCKVGGQAGLGRQQWAPTPCRV